MYINDINKKLWVVFVEELSNLKIKTFWYSLFKTRKEARDYVYRTKCYCPKNIKRNTKIFHGYISIYNIKPQNYFKKLK
jgi:hypothetical protein